MRMWSLEDCDHATITAYLRGIPGAERIIVTLDNLRHGRSGSIPGQATQNLYMPGLRAQPFWDPRMFLSYQDASGVSAALREEFESLWFSNHLFLPYEDALPGKDPCFPTPLDKGWRTLALLRDGVWKARAASEATEALALLDRLDPYPGDAMYSVLLPQTRIPAHHGLTNLALTLHLPLLADPGACLTVNGETRDWMIGRPLLFDDTFSHAAENPSNRSLRVVFLVDLWHPDLSPVERDVWCELLPVLRTLNLPLSP